MTKTLTEIKTNVIRAHLNTALVLTLDSRIEQAGGTTSWYEMIVEPSEEGEAEVFQALAVERKNMMLFVMDDPDFEEVVQAAVETFVDDVVIPTRPDLLDPETSGDYDIFDPSDELSAELDELANILAAGN